MSGGSFKGAACSNLDTQSAFGGLGVGGGEDTARGGCYGRGWAVHKGYEWGGGGGLGTSEQLGMRPT